MNKEDLEKILKNHLLFLQSSQGGVRADLREANLSEANLYKADLREANLSEVNLYKADLREANLSEANLSEVNLYKADLSEADLRGANLRGADLRGANLLGAKGVLSFTGEKHLLVYFKTSGIYYMKIGCITKPIETWISDFKNIGRSEGYSEEHIKLYGEVIKLFSTYEITEEE